MKNLLLVCCMTFLVSTLTAQTEIEKPHILKINLLSAHPNTPTFEYERQLTTRTALEVGFGFRPPFEYTKKGTNSSRGLFGNSTLKYEIHQKDTRLKTAIGYRVYLNKSTFNRFFITPTLGFSLAKREGYGILSRDSESEVVVKIDQSDITSTSLGLKIGYQGCIHEKFILGVNLSFITTQEQGYTLFSMEDIDSYGSIMSDYSKREMLSVSGLGVLSTPAPLSIGMTHERNLFDNRSVLLNVVIGYKF